MRASYFAADSIEKSSLEGITADFVEDGPELLARWGRHHGWTERRLASNVESYGRATVGRISADARTRLRNGAMYSGVNFGSQDYLNLAAHPSVHGAAKKAIDTYGVHSAGSVALMGSTELSIALESRLAAFLGYRDCTIFPTGWGAGYGLVKTLVRRDDHVVIDILAHACLQEGARNATPNVHRFPHCSNMAVQRRLAGIRAQDSGCGILVVTEGVFSMDSDVPDLRELQEICRRYDATLMVDVAHDLGALGATGRGVLELQDMVGKVDVVMGSFSKTFASNGGFVATNEPALKTVLRYNCGPLTFTNALSPVQAAIVLSALDIVEGDEGAELRAKLMANVLRLRAGLDARAFQVLGRPSAIVPVVLGGSPVSRLATRYAFENGAIVNLVEYPAVSRNSCRWRLQVMAQHTAQHIDTFIEIAVAAQDAARQYEKDVERAEACAAL
ncbi:MAG: hypothetical protein ABS35_33775 [Kaistia sp. SCN 65-12]|nr:MAG: hypothetical protein ABS35_33775 [Kaistia sp. SCN 65-12]